MKNTQRIFLSLAILTIPCTLNACGGAKETAVTVSDTARVTPSNLLPLPVIPDSIFDPQERADYTVLHYWDSLSPDDKRCSDHEFMDANFAQYADQFNYASSDGAAYAVSVLLDQLANYSAQIKLMADLAIKYFGGRNSESFSEKSLIIWMQELAQSPVIDSAMRDKYAFMLEAATKNAPGTKAADINFSMRGGKLTSLYQIPAAPYTLLVLYDPECESCHTTIEKVKQDKRIMSPVNKGQVRVLLIDVADNRSAFEYDSTQYPEKWIIGYDESRVEDNDIYIFEKTPTFYLLDKNKTVLLKDASIDDLVEYARTASAM